MAAKIIPFRRPEGAKNVQSTAQKRIEENVAWLVNSELARFGDSLATARFVWRKYRALVEAPQFPEHLRRPYVEEFAEDPDQPSVDFGAPAISRKQMRAIRSLAEEWARERHPEAT